MSLDSYQAYGGSLLYVNCPICAKVAKNWENVQKIMKKKEKVLDISPEINATILHTPACTQK